MMKFIWFCLLYQIFLCVKIVHGIANISIKWNHHIKLSSKMELKWNTDDPEWITIEMRSNSKGYLGIGFSEFGGMAGSDIYLGWVYPSGSAFLKDYHGVINGPPIEDEKQDLELIYALEDDIGTRIAFRRKWDTCDSQDMSLNINQTVRVIWAWDENDPNPGYTPHYHGSGSNHGSSWVTISGVSTTIKFPDEGNGPNVKEFNMALFNVQVPKTHEYYYCDLFKFPNLNAKHHIIGYKLIGDKFSRKYISRVKLFKCHVPKLLGRTQDFFEKYVVNYGNECVHNKVPFDWLKYCQNLLFSLADGTEEVHFQMDMGYPIELENQPIYFMLNVEYDNPTGAHFYDNSGLKIIYTESVRKYDMSILRIGHRKTPFLTIPPFQDSFKIVGHCDTGCTNEGLSSNGIKILSVLLLAKKWVKSIIIRHFRGIAELKPLFYNQYFSPKYREFIQLDKAVSILPGDQLFVECDYTTRNTVVFVQGGLLEDNEECEALLMYFPKSNLGTCQSQPEFYSYFNAFGLENASGRNLETMFMPYKSNGGFMSLPLPDDSFLLEFKHTQMTSFHLYNHLNIQNPVNSEFQSFQKYLRSLDWTNKTLANFVEHQFITGSRYIYCSTPSEIQLRNVTNIGKLQNYRAYEHSPRPCESGNYSSSVRIFQIHYSAYFSIIIIRLTL